MAYSRFLRKLVFGVLGRDFRIVQDQFSDSGSGYRAADRILDAVDAAVRLNVDRRIFERQIRVDEQAILHLHVFHVAHTLVALDDAVDEGDVLGIPTQIFTDDRRIPDDHILAIPESIF